MKFAAVLAPAFVTLVGFGSAVQAARPYSTPLRLVARDRIFARQFPSECVAVCGPLFDPTCDDSCACAQLDNVEACLACGVREGAATQASANEAMQEIEGICAALSDTTAPTPTPRPPTSPPSSPPPDTTPSVTFISTPTTSVTQPTLTGPPPSAPPTQETIFPSDTETETDTETAPPQNTLNPETPNAGRRIGAGVSGVVVGAVSFVLMAML